MKYKEKTILFGAFIFLWINSLLVFGTLLVLLSSPNLITLIAFLISIGIALPIKTIYRNLESLENVFKSFLRQNSGKIVFSLILFVPSSLSFIYGFTLPGFNLLNLSFHASSRAFFPVKHLYSEIFGNSFGILIFNYGRWYLHFLWSYLLVSLASDLLTKLFFKEDSQLLEANVLPFKDEKDKDADNLIELYIITGSHTLFKVPENFCKECNMFYHKAKEAAEQSEQNVDIIVKSYWFRFLRPVLKGGIHPPVMLIDGELVAQGHDVPDVGSIIDRLNDGDEE